MGKTTHDLILDRVLGMRKQADDSPGIRGWISGMKNRIGSHLRRNYGFGIPADRWHAEWRTINAGNDKAGRPRQYPSSLSGRGLYKDVVYYRDLRRGFNSDVTPFDPEYPAMVSNSVLPSVSRKDPRIFQPRDLRRPRL